MSDPNMNLKSVRRIDPYIKRIITSHASVCQYLYDCESSAWSKTETEGTFFLYERESDPLFGFLILNRLSAKNLVETITPDLELMLQQPFILYKTKDGAICGLWFYEESTCLTVHAKMVELVETAKARMRARQRTPQQGHHEEPPQHNANDDLAAKLNLASIKDSAHNGQVDPRGANKLSAMLNSALTVSNVPPNAAPVEPKIDDASGNVAAFFAQASVHQSAFSAPNAIPFHSQPRPVPIDNKENSASNTTPFFLPPQMRHMMPPVNKAPAIAPFVQNQQVREQEEQRGPVPPETAASPNMLMATLMKNPSAHSLATIEERMHSPKPLNEPSKMQLPPGIPMPSLPPIPTQAPTAAELEKSSVRAAAASPIAKQLNVIEEAELLSPMVLMGNRGGQQGLRDTNGGIDLEVTPLTKSQFVQALDHLLRTDPSFVSKLHQSYVESLNVKLHMN